MNKWINVAGKILAGIGIVASVLNNLIEEKKIDRKIEEKVQKALANMNKAE